MHRAIILQITVFLSILTAGGCGTARFAVSPPEPAATVTGKQPLTQVLAPLTYAFHSKENRLVVEAINDGPDTLMLDGDRSYVITPDGLSMPLGGRVAPPGSRVKLILPPFEPRYRDNGNIHFGVGVGTMIGQARGQETAPVYLMQMEESWAWPKGGEARLGLVWQTQVEGEARGKTFKHEFQLRKMK